MTRRLRRTSALGLAMLILPGTAAAQPAAAQPAAAQPAAAEVAPEPAPATAAPPSRDQCLAAHKSAQELKQSGKFLEAQEHLVICSAETCPGAVISDCGTWIGNLERVTPSMIFEIRANGREAPDAKLFVDEKPVLDLSHAVKVNPGRHSIRVELPPFPAYVEALTLPEGQRMRLVSVDFLTKQAPPPPVQSAPPPEPVREPERPTPFIVYPLLGVGVAGLASFGVFSLLGQQKQAKLEETCAPSCSDEELDPMKKMYLIGDISAGVGLALLTSAIVYLTRPTESPSDTRAALSVSVGSVARSSGSFGVTAGGSF